MEQSLEKRHSTLRKGEDTNIKDDGIQLDEKKKQEVLEKIRKKRREREKQLEQLREETVDLKTKKDLKELSQKEIKLEKPEIEEIKLNKIELDEIELDEIELDEVKLGEPEIKAWKPKETKEQKAKTYREEIQDYKKSKEPEGPDYYERESIFSDKEIQNLIEGFDMKDFQEKQRHERKKYEEFEKTVMKKYENLDDYLKDSLVSKEKMKQSKFQF